MSDVRERRRERRRPTYGRAVIGDTLLAYVRDLSPEGARLSVVSEAMLEPGRRFDARLIISTETPIEIEGVIVVVWSERVGAFCDVGVRFCGAEPGALEAARQAVAHLDEQGSRHEPKRGVRVEFFAERQSG